MKIIQLSGKNLKNAAAYLKHGATIVFPTDTVYGLLADATNKQAVNRIFKIKKRDRSNPLPIFVKDIRMAKNFAEIDADQEKFLKKAWPGKITAVLKRKKSGIKLYGVDSKTVALRISKHKLLLNLVKQLNCPLVGTSANISGLPASTKIKEIINQFQGQKYKNLAFGENLDFKKYQPDFVVDAGNLPKSKASKIIDLTVLPFKILRP